MSALNIVRFFDSVPDATRTVAVDWYASARALAAELSPENVERGAGVIAALSPMLSWPLNVKYARMVFAGETYIPCLKSNAYKAQLIYAGVPVDVILSGDKVNSFYQNIIGIDAERVTIDRHAVDLALDIPGYYSQNGIKASEYATFVKEYTVATIVINRLMGTEYTPAQVQAITWTHWRQTRAKSYNGEA